MLRRTTLNFPLSRSRKGNSYQTLSPDGETLLLTDTKNKQLSVIRVTPIYKIEIGQSPIMGKADAPVSVFAFIDYQ